MSPGTLINLATRMSVSGYDVFRYAMTMLYDPIRWFGRVLLSGTDVHGTDVHQLFVIGARQLPKPKRLKHLSPLRIRD
jgi:hypothetical protein